MPETDEEYKVGVDELFEKTLGNNKDVLRGREESDEVKKLETMVKKRMEIEKIPFTEMTLKAYVTGLKYGVLYESNSDQKFQTECMSIFLAIALIRLKKEKLHG